MCGPQYIYIYIYIYIYTRRKDGAKAPSLLDHLGHFVAKYLGHSSWASAYELLRLGPCVEFLSFACWVLRLFQLQY